MTQQNQVKSSQESLAAISAASLARAERALRCSPFTLQLLADMAMQGIALRAIAAQEGMKNKYIKHSESLITVETALLWLVTVGILRREVDGQGITDSFRLTPMGYYLLEKWQPQGFLPAASWRDRCQDFLAQWQISRWI